MLPFATYTRVGWNCFLIQGIGVSYPGSDGYDTIRLVALVSRVLQAPNYCPRYTDFENHFWLNKIWRIMILHCDSRDLSSRRTANAMNSFIHLNESFLTKMCVKTVAAEG